LKSSGLPITVDDPTELDRDDIKLGCRLIGATNLPAFPIHVLFL
jgi:hypothetical protein